MLMPNIMKAAVVATLVEFFELLISRAVPMIPKMAPPKCVYALVNSFLSVFVITPPT